MGWREDYEKEHAELKAELGSLIIGEGIKPLEERFFKNFGCINFRDADFFHELKLARMFHLWHFKEFPDRHDLHEFSPYNCYTVTSCKCGFREEVDSSD